MAGNANGSVTGDARVRNHGSYDWALLFTVTAMLGLGLVMVFSASYPRGLEGFDDPFYFIMRQLAWLAVGRRRADRGGPHPLSFLEPLEHSPDGAGAAGAAGRDRLWRRALWRHPHLYQRQHPAQRTGQDHHHHLRQRLVDEQGPPHPRRTRRAAALWRADGDRVRLDRAAAGDLDGHPDRGNGGRDALYRRRRHQAAAGRRPHCRPYLLAGDHLQLLCRRPCGSLPGVGGQPAGQRGVAGEPGRAGAHARRPVRAVGSAAGWRSRRDSCPSVGATISTA